MPCSGPTPQGLGQHTGDEDRDVLSDPARKRNACAFEPCLLLETIALGILPPKKTDHLCRSQVVSETAIDGLTGWVRGRGRHNPSGSPSGNLGVQRAAAAAGSMPVLRTMGAAAGAARKRIKCEATAVSAAPSATPAEKKTRC